VLPHAIAYNAAAAPAAMATIARALGRPVTDGDAALGLYELAGAIGVERSLAALGMPADGLDRAAELAAANPYANPRPIDRAAIRDLLTRAFTGAAPHARA
jgi:alcohol dehydrogenase class IV